MVAMTVNMSVGASANAWIDPSRLMWAQLCPGYLGDHDSVISEPAKIEIPSWLRAAASSPPLPRDAPAKVIRHGKLAAVVSVEEDFREGLFPAFQPPHGTAFGTGSAAPVPAAQRAKPTRTAALKPTPESEICSEAETCSDLDGSAPSLLPSLDPESAGSGSDDMGQASKCGTKSIGSALHDNGECRPCAWYWKPTGCENGHACQFCHMCPEGEVKMRKRSKLMALRQARRGPEQHGGVGAFF